MEIKKWRLPQSQETVVQALAQKTGLPLHICTILAARGHTDPEEAQRFLRGQGELPNPYLLKDMDKAVERISQAVEDGEFIAVYGDYDCDGITSTALLYTYFQDIGARVMYYIPDRDTEGYGLNNGAIDALNRLGVDLIVTVDNGVSALEQIDYANSLGMEVVVTDHHQPQERLPKAVAVVDAHRADCTYPFKHLCGAGIAFKLICAMEGDLTGEEMLEHFGAITALGTIADVVELTGENRAIVKAGLRAMAQEEQDGLHILMEESGVGRRGITSTSVAFGIVPRINAAGRVGKAELALELLLSQEPEEARELAQKIEELNGQRKEWVQEILDSIDALTARQPELLEQRVLILAGENWHPGVIGIAAARLVERYSKPCLLISLEGDMARGSARSVEGYSVIKAISRCSVWLTLYGGHDQAAGFSLRSTDVDSFRQAMLEDARENFDIMPVDELSIDAVAPIGEINVRTVEQLSMLEPFGFGNELPVLMIQNCTLEAVTPLSEDRHIRIRCQSAGKTFQALYFGMSSKRFPYSPGDHLDLAVTLDLNHFNGDTSVTIKIKSVRPRGIPQDKLVVGRQYYEKVRREEPVTRKIQEYITPDREDVAVLYRYLRRTGPFPFGYDQLWCRLGGQLNYCKMRLCLDIMEELSLLEVKAGEEPVLCLPAQPMKADLERSHILRKLKGGDVCAYIR